MPTIIARTIVAIALAAFILTGCAPMAAAPMPTAAPAVAADYAAWVACVDAAWAADDPSDSTLQACDARHGSHWTYPESA